MLSTVYFMFTSRTTENLIFAQDLILEVYYVYTVFFENIDSTYQ